MKGISRLLNKKCKRFKHHIRNILQNDIANKYITLNTFLTEGILRSFLKRLI